MEVSMEDLLPTLRTSVARMLEDAWDDVSLSPILRRKVDRDRTLVGAFVVDPFHHSILRRRVLGTPPQLRWPQQKLEQGHTSPLKISLWTFKLKDNKKNFFTALHNPAWTNCDSEMMSVQK